MAAGRHVRSPSGRWLRARSVSGRAWAAAAIIAVIALTVSTPPPLSDWQPVPTRQTGQITSLTSAAGGTLVGRYDPDAAVKPSITLLTADGSEHPIPLSPTSGYAPLARWESLAASPAEIVGVAGARGGAHGNVRWTIWRGTSVGVIEQPQTFETFGGWLGGVLVGAALPEQGEPLVVGTWSNPQQTGYDVTTWRAVGERWVRDEPTDPALAGTPTFLPTPVQVAVTGRSVLVVGWATDLSSGVRVVPVLWRRDENLHWGRQLLPQGSPFATMALGVGCDPTSCLVLGRTKTGVVGWRITPQPAGQPVVAAPPGVAELSGVAGPFALPGSVASDPASLPAPALDGRGAALLALPGPSRDSLLATLDAHASKALDAGRLPGAPVAAAGTREEGWFVATRAGDGATRLWHNRFHTASGGR